MLNEKEELLQKIVRGMETGLISRGDLEGFLAQPATPEKQGKRLAFVFYYIGSLIILLGLGIFIAQQWETLAKFGHILVTLGAGFAFFVSAVILGQKHSWSGVSDAFHFLAAMLIPSGILITLNEYGVDITLWKATGIFAFLTAAYFLAHRLLSRTVLLIFSIVYGTLTFFFTTSAIVGTAPIIDEQDFFGYRLFVTGIVYILLGYSWEKSVRKNLTGPLYFFGVPLILGGTMMLQGWNPDQSYFWEILYPGILFGFLYLSVILRSRSFLIFSALFLIAEVIKITMEYFENTFSWPILLMIGGGAVMGIGYMTLALHRKYFPRQNQTQTQPEQPKSEPEAS